MTKPEIIIIGCGVSGLTCGIKLLEDGFKTKVIASKLPPSTTSDIAPAYWYPYKVKPLDKVLKWGAISYSYFTRLSEVKESGISFTNLIKLYDKEVPIPPWTKFTRKLKKLPAEELPDGYRFGFSTEVPLIETPIYMYYLVNRFVNTGGEIIKLKNDIKSINEYLDVNIFLINCTGLGSYSLFDDQNMYPIRGQLVRTTNPGIKNIYSDQDAHLALSYIVPRKSDCILGGTADDHNWDTAVSKDISDQIMLKCKKIVPELKDTIVLDNIVGLRPGRDKVRLEYEKLNFKYKIVHNYGHGGAGFTLSWGCAEEVSELVKTNI
jgi:D-amino-acid oxidase